MREVEGPQSPGQRRGFSVGMPVYRPVVWESISLQKADSLIDATGDTRNATSG